MSDLRKCRDDFELWATTEAGWKKASIRMRLGRYRNHDLRLLWHGFSAAWNRRTTQPAISQGRREAFEAWLADVHMLHPIWQPERNCYKEYPAHLAFQAWQASPAHPASAPDDPQIASDADKLRRLRDGMDKWGWCAEFGALAMEVLREPSAQGSAVTVDSNKCTPSSVVAQNGANVSSNANAADVATSGAVEVKVERNRVWIVKAHQSFMLAYEGDTDEELNWYADTLRAVLSNFTRGVNSPEQAAPNASEINGLGPHVPAQQAAQQQAATVPDDPMDWPLPCDVKVGHGTIGKGCKLRTLVARMHVLYNMAQESLPKVTPEMRTQFDALFNRAAATAPARPADLHNLILGQAVAHFECKWPKMAPEMGDVMVFNGQRITKAEFEARAAATTDGRGGEA